MKNISSEMRFRNWHENPTELRENHPQSVTFVFTGKKQAGAEEWPQRGQEGRAALSSSLPLAATHLVSQASGSL